MGGVHRKLAGLHPRGVQQIFDQRDKVPTISEDCVTVVELSELARETLLCALGKTAPNPFLSTFRYFRDEYEAHIHDRRCPALSCKDLIAYYIDPDKCTACLLCLKRCPDDAIDGAKGKIHIIDQDRCTNCGTCFDVCPPRYGAVKKLSGEPVPDPIPEARRTVVKQPKAKKARAAGGSR